MRTITCFGDWTSGTFLIIALVSRTKITCSQGPITLFILLTAGRFLALPSVYFYFFLVLSVSRPKLPLNQLSSPDDVIISQL